MIGIEKPLKTCEVCGSTEGRIYGKPGKLKMDLCRNHYHQIRYKILPKVENSDKQCEICGTNKGKIYGKTGKFAMDLCSKHRTQMIKYGEIHEKKPKEIKKCKYCDTIGERVNYSNKYKINICDKHWAQLKSHGKILERTRFDPNEIVICDGYAEIILYNKQGNESARTIIDISDIAIVKGMHWSYDRQDNYAKTNINGKSVGLHRFITGCPDGFDPDHINNNGLDNRRLNLRIVTRSQNSMNSRMKSNNKSGITGVSWDKTKNQWHVKICVNYKQKTIGYYNDLEDAINARMEAVKQYHGEFAYKGANL